MAFRPSLTSAWKSMLRTQGKRRLASSSTASTIENAATSSKGSPSRSEYMKGEYAPVYIVLGFVGIVLMMGTHTAKQQLLHSPVVNVSKKKRESIPEVEEPDTVINSADKFINKSILRKVAHIQDNTKTV
ncbi:uncharacterized protein LOC111778418 [Cucurbita pepo subsp. pepo]|uniref:uncharacterized protein LOC111778418 n=1 Tax=Cucurbita pepo subsp. pepo TaxID=3664 RepID=UPI000C9D3D9D|nr:uncharacterized protein LOC111778418 [Cucurbita pepo subsp. pepo]